MKQEIRVYTISKLCHGQKLRLLRHSAEALGVYFTARWPLLREDELSRPAAQWVADNMDDIIRSHAALVYIERGERLRFGLVEVGIALREGLHIWLVDPFEAAGEAIQGHPDYADWQGHPLVHRNATIEGALRSIKQHFFPDTRIAV